MSNPTKGGKRHISEKPEPRPAKSMFNPLNLLDVSPELHKEIADQGMEYRWIDAKKFADQGNVHVNHWQVYRRTTDSLSGGTTAFGLPPDGSVRRGTLVLAVRPKGVGEGHREHLRNKAENQSSQVKKQGAELKRIARQGGLDERIFDETEID